MKFLLTAFADEASAEIGGQIEALHRNDMKYIELRGINNKSAYDYSYEESKEFAKIYRDNGITVSSLGSPLGKIKITDDFEPHFEFTKKCVELANIYSTKLMRIFSFYIPAGEDPKNYRNEVIDRVGKIAEYAKENGILACHENEAKIYGESAENCVDILDSLEGKIGGIFDPANFIVTSHDIPTAYSLLKGRFEYMHIKDALMETKQIVPAGEGDGCIPQILKEYAEMSDRDRFLTLEPHLAVFEGLGNLQHEELKHKHVFKSRDEAFDTAVQTLKKVIKNEGLQYE